MLREILRGKGACHSRIRMVDIRIMIIIFMNNIDQAKLSPGLVTRYHDFFH